MDSIKDVKGLFRDVYPFTTEMIAGYMPTLEVKNKSVLTVGSSCDQVFNALVEDASNVTLFDINSSTGEFYKLKKNIILSVERDDLYDAVMNIEGIPLSKDVFAKVTLERMNNYMKNDYNYDKLRERLTDSPVEFIEGDIFDFDLSVCDAKYDRIILSNILQYLSMNARGRDLYEFLGESFNSWKSHLSDDGILQMLYIYSCGEPGTGRIRNTNLGYDLRKIVNTLEGNSLEFSWFKDCFDTDYDGIVTYQKRR